MTPEVTPTPRSLSPYHTRYNRQRLKWEIDTLSRCASRFGLSVAETILQLIDYDLGFDDIMEPELPAWKSFKWPKSGLVTIL